jgi:hypothetical protein
LGQLKEAAEMHARVLEIRQRVLGEQHPNTLRIMNNLALTQLSMGQLKEAAEMDVRELEIRQRMNKSVPHAASIAAACAAQACFVTRI